jgi:hypothetical protein
VTDTSEPSKSTIGVSVSYPLMHGAPTANGRVYPPALMHEAMLKAQREGTLKVTVEPDPLTGKSSNVPVQLGDKRFINPKFTLQSMSMNADGSLSGSFDVEERAGVVDRLADVALKDEEA